MAQHCSLPPPIHDPSTGKTFIAIPAPSFIFKNDASTSAESANKTKKPGYVYVEKTQSEPKPIRMFAPDRACEEQKPSVDKWMAKSCPAEPPPGHLPWRSEVTAISPISSDCSLAETTLAAPMQDISDCGMYAIDSADTLELPDIDNGDTLLNGSLPSLCSSEWSGDCCSPPPISTSNSTPAKPNPSPALCRFQRASKTSRKSRNSKAETRRSNAASRRKASVLDRRLTLEKMSKVRDTVRRHYESDNVEGRIDELDTFFSVGMKKMDSTLRQLGEEENKFRAPSLVISTSTAIVPVSFDSDTDVLSTPLAMRRGKKAPLSLKLEVPTFSDSFGYPDVPSAFQCSPNLESACFSEPPKYPSLVLDSKLTAEQMIVSLRNQVQNFHPKSPSGVLQYQCVDAKKWLEGELVGSPTQSSSAKSCSQVRNTNSPPTYETTRRSSMSIDNRRPSAAEVGPEALNFQTTGNKKQVKLHSEVMEGRCNKTPQRRGSDGSLVNVKRVRFSLDPPSASSPEAKQPRRGTISSSTPSSGASTTSPTKRKPAPRVSMLVAPGPTKLLPPTPMRGVCQNAPRISSPLNPARQTAPPLSTVLPSTPTSSTGPKACAKGRANSMTAVAAPAVSSPHVARSPLNPTHQSAPYRAISPPIPSIGPKPMVKGRGRSMTTAAASSVSPPSHAAAAATSPLNSTRRGIPSYTASQSTSPNGAVSGRARSMTAAAVPAANFFSGAARRRASEATIHTSLKARPLNDVQNYCAVNSQTQPETTCSTSGAKESRRLRIRGLSFAKRRVCFNEENKENVDIASHEAHSVKEETLSRKKDKASKTLSLPFQGVFNLLRG